MNFIVNTPCGPVQGCAGRVPGTVAYKGIRYGTAGRWEYPRQVTAWAGTYDATNYGSCSYQPRAFYDEEQNKKKYFYYNEFRKGEHYTYSEDCLFLNIFTPDTATEGQKLPVIFYIHGGGFTGGCGHEKHFDGPVWPTRGVIGITINYRLGPMGFVTLPQLKEEAGFTGNYGLYDQVCALSWVKENIAAFGGDPENITIMGQSAGAMSVQQLVCSSLTVGLFQKAVMSSGGGVNKMMASQPAEKTYEFWHACMKTAGCENLEQFRSLAPEKLFAAWQETKKTTKGGMCSPCIDGRLVTMSGFDALAQGRQHKIPYMAGSNSQDLMVPILFNMAKSWCTAQPVPSYAWYFSRSLPGDNHRAWHSADLWYWFGTLENCWRPMEKKDYDLSRQMVDYLCAFAASGTPQGTGYPAWKQAGTQAMLFSDKPTAMGNPSMARMIATMLTNKAVGE